jgi:sugar phosphate isomerase/epimerase
VRTRRQFLSTAAVALTSAIAGAKATRAAGDRPDAGDYGLQLWSLRAYLPKDLRGTLARIREWGFAEVEGAGLWHQTASGLRSALDEAGLRCRSAHMDFERLRDRPSEAFDEATTLGAKWVVCPWIAHEGSFTRDVALAAADVFNRAGKAARERGLRLSYHCHGYEFVPSTEGTLFDTLAGAADASLVTFQIDVFHAFFGGADPVALIRKHGARVTSLHLKDLKKGVPVVAGTAIAPAEVDVPLGTGQVDIAGAVSAARAAGCELFYIEDESQDPIAHIPQSLAFLTHQRA